MKNNKEIFSTLWRISGISFGVIKYFCALFSFYNFLSLEYESPNAVLCGRETPNDDFSNQKMSSFTLIFVTLMCFHTVLGRSNSYYDIVNAIAAGKNLYELLGVNKEATSNDLRKAFRQKSLQ